MTETLDELQPIADIVGPTGVGASYGETEVYDRHAEAYRLGWTVKVDATYKGATIRFSESASSLEVAANRAHQQLKDALGLN